MVRTFIHRFSRTFSRGFIRTFIRSTAGLVLVVIACGLHAEGFQYEEGTHFKKLPDPIRTRNPDVVEVSEYFSYGCPHCYGFEPLVQQWQETLAEDVIFNRTPAIWQVTGYELFARTYYTTLVMGVLEQTHSRLFQALHSENRRIRGLEDMTKFMVELGVNADEFVRTFSSFGVNGRYKQAIARQLAYKSEGVPAVIVNGKYRVEAKMVDGSNAGMLEVVNFLVDRERRLLAAGKSGGE